MPNTVTIYLSGKPRVVTPQMARNLVGRGVASYSPPKAPAAPKAPTAQTAQTPTSPQAAADSKAQPAQTTGTRSVDDIMQGVLKGVKQGVTGLAEQVAKNTPAKPASTAKTPRKAPTSAPQSFMTSFGVPVPIKTAQHVEAEDAQDRAERAQYMARTEATRREYGQQLDEAEAKLRAAKANGDFTPKGKAAILQGLKNFALPALNSIFPGLGAAAGVLDKAISEDDYDRAMRIISEERQKLDDIENNEGGSFFGALGQTFNRRNWSGGVVDLQDARMVKRIYDKYQNGEQLTDGEREVLQLVGSRNEMADVMDEGRSQAAVAGDITGQSLPFMAGFFMTGGFSTLGEGVTSAVAKGGSKAASKMAATRAGTKAAENAVLRSIGTKAGNLAATVAGDVAAAGAQTATFGLGHIAADAISRNTGNIHYALDQYGQLRRDSDGLPVLTTKKWVRDENGNPVEVEGGEDWVTAIAKAAGSQFIENYTELLGAHMSFLPKSVSEKPFVKAFDKMAGKVGFNGLPEEIAEEEAGIFLNSLFGIEDVDWTSAAKEGAAGIAATFGAKDAAKRIRSTMTDEEREASEQFWDNQWDIVTGIGASMALLGGAHVGMNALNYGRNKYGYYATKRGVDRADRVARMRLDGAGRSSSAAMDEFGLSAEDRWNNLRSRIDATETKDIPQLWEELRDSNEYEPQELNAIYDYMRKLQLHRGFNAASMQVPTTPEQDDDMAATSAGYNAAPEERSTIQARYDAAADAFRKAFDIDEEADIENWLSQKYTTDGSSSSYMHAMDANAPDLAPETRQTMAEYFNARSAVEGMQMRMSEEVEDQVADSNEWVKRNTFTEGAVTGVDMEGQPAAPKIVQATTKEGKQVYIVNGDLRYEDPENTYVNGGYRPSPFNTEGPAAIEQHGGTLIVRDAETGELSMISDNDIEAQVNHVDAEAFRASREEQIREAAAQEQSRQMGEPQFEPGDNYYFVDDRGNAHTAAVTIQGVQDGEGNVMLQKMVSINGMPAMPLTDAIMGHIANDMRRTRKMQVAAEDAATAEVSVEDTPVVDNPVETPSVEAQDGEQPVATPAAPDDPGSYKLDDEVNAVSDAGNPVRGKIIGVDDVDGSLEVEWEDGEVDGNIVGRYTPADLDAFLARHQEATAAPAIEPADNNDNAAAETPSEAAETPVQSNAEGAGTFSMPTKSDGSEDYRSAGVENTIQYLEDAYADEDNANEAVAATIKANADAAQSARDKWEKKRPKPGTSPAKYKTEKARWQETADELQEEVDFWDVVKRTRDNARREQDIYDTDHRSASQISAQLGEPRDLEEAVVMAMPGYKFIWGDNPTNRTRGVGSHIGANTEAERRNRVAWTGREDKGALYPEQVAEQIHSNLPNSESVDYNDVLNIVLDTLRSYNSPRAAIQALADNRSEVSRREREAEAAYYEGMHEEEARNAGFDNVDDYDAWRDASEAYAAAESSNEVAARDAYAAEEADASAEAVESGFDAEVEDAARDAIAAAEAETATAPTDAQKEAGNYKKGHVKLDGYNLTIENPKGSTRSGKDADGKPWSVTMNNTYGYIRGTEGADGDHIDVFLSDNPTSGNVYVVDQVNADGTFDEHKVMYGFDSAEEAREAYLANYSEGWQGLGNITEVSKDEFKKWVNSSHRKTKPFADYKSVKPMGAQNEGEESTDTVGASPVTLEYLLEGGLDVIKSTGYFLHGVAAAFERISGKIEGIRGKYLSQINDKPAEFVNDTTGALQEIRDAVMAEYGQEGVDVLNELLANATGFAPRVGKQMGIRIEEMNNAPKPSAPAAMSESEADELIASMKEHAEAQPANVEWDEVFGESAVLDTPIGNVKMGENQKAKLEAKGRASQLGMLVGTLNDPDIIIEEKDKDDNMFHERNSSYLFVKTFKKADGEKYVHFESVTISQDGMEISVSSHIIREKALKKKLMESGVIYTKETLFPNSSEWHLAEHQNGVPDLLPTQENNVSKRKGTEESGNKQEISEKSADGAAKKPTRAEKAKKAQQQAQQLELDFFSTADAIDEAIREDAPQAEPYTPTPDRYGVKEGDKFLTKKGEVITLNRYDRNPNGTHSGVYSVRKDGMVLSNGGVKDEEIQANLASGKWKPYTADNAEPAKPAAKWEVRHNSDTGEITLQRYTENPNGTRTYNARGKQTFKNAEEALAVLRNPANKMQTVLDEYEKMLTNIAEYDAIQAERAAEAAKPVTPEKGESPLDFADRLDAANREKAEAAKPKPTRLVSDERMEELKKKLRNKLRGQLNVGVDPEVLAIGTELAVGHIERGFTKFADYAKAMIEDIGDVIRPYLKSFYNAVRDMPEAADYADAMDSYDEVRKADVNAIGITENEPETEKTEKKSQKTEEKVVNSQPKEEPSLFDSDNVDETVTEQKPQFKVGDKVMYKGEEATIHSIETLGGETEYTLDTGMAPVMYEVAHDGEITLTPNNNEQVQGLQQRAPERGRNRQSANQNGTLGESQQPQTEGSQRGRVDAGNAIHPASNGQRTARPHGVRAQSRQLLEGQNQRNNRAERGTDYAPKSPAARYRANIAAIKLSQKLQESGAVATPEQMEVLRKYSGWGGLGTYLNNDESAKELRDLIGNDAFDQAAMSANSAYFTPAYVVDTLWDVAEKLGFKGGNILEGSAGIGNILGLMPQGVSDHSAIHAVEIDGISGAILSQLYPDAQVDIKGFEETKIPNGSVDLAITNAPFVTGLMVRDTTGDKDLSKRFRNIHDFCIAKNVRKLREGGLGIFITTSGTLDKSTDLRGWITKEGNADVVGAFRLNNETFGGTNATSDIIIVRKRVNGVKSPNAIDVSSVSAVRSTEYATGEYTVKAGKRVEEVQNLTMTYNGYFAQHPENMGGTMDFNFEHGDTFRPTGTGLYAQRGVKQNDALEAWVNSFDGFSAEAESTKAASPADEVAKLNERLGSGVKEGSLVVNSKGEICVAHLGEAVPIKQSDKKVKGHTRQECLESYNAVKSALADVLDYQSTNADDEGLKPLLKKLNQEYDKFVATYGPFTKNVSIAFLKNDVDYASMTALEHYEEKGDKKGKRKVTISKRDVFNKRVVKVPVEPQPKNIADAITASIFTQGGIDLPYIAEKLNITEEDAKKQALEDGHVFENPATGGLEVDYEYLSGNVREKLNVARENEAAYPGRYAANVSALEAVVPMTIPAHLIEYNIGSSWVDKRLFEEYVKARTGATVNAVSANGTWELRQTSHGTPHNNRDFGVYSDMFKKHILGTTLIEAAMANRSISVSETHKDRYTGTTETITDKVATQACMNKIGEIRQDFKEWAKEYLQQNEEFAQKIEEEYNNRFNNYVPKSIPKSYQREHLDGAWDGITLYPHQSSAVTRALTEPVLLAHEVGTGKTFTQISIAMEMRRLGTARKPMIVVQNATVGQFVASAKLLYPGAKVLTIEDNDKTAEGRKNFYAKIKYNDWDMIVVPQSVFERIPDSPERQAQFIQSKIDEKLATLEALKNEQENNNGSSMIVRSAERELEDLRAQLSEIAVAASDKKKKKDAKREEKTKQNAAVRAAEMLDREVDDVEDFDDMGIDAILVDEAHEYKHLGFATAMQRGVKGVDPSYSKKAQSVYLKTQAVLEKSGGKNVVFATGTPISNTAAEIWTFMKYLMPERTMKDYGIYYFDDFVRNFGSIQQMLEFKTSGKFGEVNRFSAYVNLPELNRIWSSVADTVLTADAGKVSDKIPAIDGGKAEDIYLPQSRSLRAIMASVRAELERFEQMSGKDKKANSHIPLVCFGIAAKAAIDPRLASDNAPDEPQSKTNRAVEEVYADLQKTKSYKGTCAIFCDSYRNKNTGFNVYNEIADKLIAKGVPADQIFIMTSGMSVKKKAEVFDKVNRGEIRVILGSTQTLGTGVNIQERLHLLIHMDVPNRPMDYTQRNGRILRQGNLHKEWDLPVRILRFGVEDSLDVTGYQRLKTKGAIADSIMNGRKTLVNNQENRTIEEEEDQFGDTIAQLSGSEYAMLKNKAERDVRKYESKKKAHEADQVYVANTIRRNTAAIAQTEKALAEEKRLLGLIEEEYSGKELTIKVGSNTFASMNDMEEFFKEFNKKQREREDKLRESGGVGTETTSKSSVDVNIGKYTFKFNTTLELYNEFTDRGTAFRIRRSMRYSCPELGLTDVPVDNGYLKNGVQDILENVVTGADLRSGIRIDEAAIKRMSEELEALRAREGKPFPFDAELEEAQNLLDEYTEKMREELEAKEAKYAEMDKEAGVADVGIGETSTDDLEDDVLYRLDDEEDMSVSSQFAQAVEGLKSHSPILLLDSVDAVESNYGWMKNNYPQHYETILNAYNDPDGPVAAFIAPRDNDGNVLTRETVVFDRNGGAFGDLRSAIVHERVHEAVLNGIVTEKEVNLVFNSDNGRVEKMRNAVKAAGYDESEHAEETLAAVFQSFAMDRVSSTTKEQLEGLLSDKEIESVIKKLQKYIYEDEQTTKWPTFYVDRSRRRQDLYGDYAQTGQSVGTSEDLGWDPLYRLAGESEARELEKEPTIRVYRAMQLVENEDGTKMLVPPMAGKIEGKWQTGIKLDADGNILPGQWEVSEERPDLLTKNGKFRLFKGNGKSVDAAYNPYFHTSPPPLNDQFSEAQARPNLVTVEVEVPVSELTSGYRAEGAKDTTGRMEWKAGIIQGQLTGTRSVVLSRYDKPARIVPDAEVAKVILGMFDGKKIIMPSNVVTPSLRAELEKLGVPFVETDNKGRLTEGENKGEYYSKVYGKSAAKLREAEQAFLDARDSGKWKRGKGHPTIDRLARHLKMWTDAFGDRVKFEVHRDGSAFIGRKAKAKGWFDPKTGKVNIILDNHHSDTDLQRTIFHEVAAHLGLRKMLGKEFYTFLNNIYENAERRIKDEIDRLAREKYNGNRATATEEYMAKIAERMAGDVFPDQVSNRLWYKMLEFAKKKLMQLLRKIGIKLNFELTDEDIAYVLWESYKNVMSSKAGSNVFETAADIDMQQRLGVRNFENEDRLRALRRKVRHMDHSVAEDASQYGRVSDDEKAYASSLANNLEEAYSSEDDDKIRKAASEIRAAASEEISFDHVFDALDSDEFDALEDYAGNNAKTLAQQYIVRVFRDRYADDDVDQEYIKTGIKTPGIGDRLRQEAAKRAKEAEISRLLKENSERVSASERSEKKGMWLYNGLVTDADIDAKIEKLRNSMTLDLANGNYEEASVTLGQLRAWEGAAHREKTSLRDELEELDFGDDIRFRDGEAYDEYESKMPNKTDKFMQKFGYRFQEAWQDSMLSLKKLQEAIVKESGKPLQDFENAYTAENRMSSMNAAAAEVYEREYYRPMIDEVAKLVDEGAEYDDIVKYVMAKHGLERNRVMTQREIDKELDKLREKLEADYTPEMLDMDDVQEEINNEVSARRQELKEWYSQNPKDFSGLSSLFSEDAFDYDAQEFVDSFEAVHNTDNLWDKINAATKNQVDRAYAAGLIDKPTSDMIKGMYDYYIPLRGFDETTAEDMYQYMTSETSPYNTPIKTAKGRKSVADDPFATIGNMAESGIMQANRNRMKQHLYRAALNHKTSLLTVGQQWYVLDNTTGQWVPQFPSVTDDMTPAEYKHAIDEFNVKMRQLEAQDLATQAPPKADVRYRAFDPQKMEHTIVVKVNGKDYNIFVNGNPRAAQAVNGQLNPDTVTKEGVFKVGKAINNWMARNFTSRNPAFVLTNLSRDVIFSGTAVMAKENGRYFAQYSKNVGSAFAHATLPRLIHKWNTRTLDDNNQVERYFREFMMMGGETGYTRLNTVEDYKKKIDKQLRELRKGKNLPRRAWDELWEGVEFLNRSAEDTTRFMVYMTSRQMGRSRERATYDAKEITVNFNKKGSGAMGAKWINLFYVFSNAAVQALKNFGQLVKNHPAKMGLAVGTFAGAGLLAPALAVAMQALAPGGDDDDHIDYWDLPEWVRRNNLVFYVPFSGNKFITIPLPHELRPFYGTGEMCFSAIQGKEKWKEVPGKAAEAFGSLLPLDFTGNGGNPAMALVPTYLLPVAQIAINTDYFGKPIYKRTPYNENDPEWTKAYKGTNAVLVDGTRWLNSITGGNDSKSGAIDINPAWIEHLFESYFGGTGQTINQFGKTISMIWNEDNREVRNIPVVNKFMQSAEERNSNSGLSNQYFRYLDEAEETERLMKAYGKRMDEPEYAAYRTELMNSDEYVRFAIMKEYEKPMEALREAEKESTDPAMQKAYKKRQVDMMREIVERLELTQTGGKSERNRKAFKMAQYKDTYTRMKAEESAYNKAVKAGTATREMEDAEIRRQMSPEYTIYELYKEYESERTKAKNLAEKYGDSPDEDYKRLYEEYYNLMYDTEHSR